MDAYKLSAKLFLLDATALLGHEFVPVFHSWIQKNLIPDHLMIDVADYQHVHNGPGTLLITHEANFATDRENGETGLLYIRKQPFATAHTFVERLSATLAATVHAAQLLEAEPSLAGKVKFRTSEFLFRIYDRLLAPSDPQTFADVKDDLQRVATAFFGAAPSAMQFTPSPDALFEVRVKLPVGPPLATLGSIASPRTTPA